MSDQRKEMIVKSKFTQLSSSFKGLILGVLLFIGSVIFIWWNEGHSIDRYQTFKEGRGIVVSIANDQVNPKNNDKLVHLYGNVTVNEELNDAIFGVKVAAIKLHRNVQMYQWQESVSTKNKTGFNLFSKEEKAYTYSKVWSEKLIDSSRFHEAQEHQNPSFMPFYSQTFISSNLYIGAFGLSDVFTNQMNLYTHYPLAQENLNSMSEIMHHNFQLSGTEYFQGDARDPEVGSIRVNFTYVKPYEVSVIGKQNNNIIDTYTTDRGTDVALLKKGRVDADAMFTWTEMRNEFFTWVFRLIAFIAMWISLGLIITPIISILNFIPVLAQVLNAGIYAVSGTLAITLTLLNIAFVWMYCRPFFASFVILIAGGIVYYFYIKKVKKIDNNQKKEKDSSDKKE